MTENWQVPFRGNADLIGRSLFQGNKVEPNFDTAEAEGIEPEITAGKLAARK